MKQKGKCAGQKKKHNSEEEAEREERRSREAGWPGVKKKRPREKGKGGKWEDTQGGEKEKGRQNAGPLGEEKGSARCDTVQVRSCT